MSNNDSYRNQTLQKVSNEKLMFHDRKILNQIAAHTDGRYENKRNVTIDLIRGHKNYRHLSRIMETQKQF